MRNAITNLCWGEGCDGERVDGWFSRDQSREDGADDGGCELHGGGLRVQKYVRRIMFGLNGYEK